MSPMTDAQPPPVTAPGTPPDVTHVLRRFAWLPLLAGVWAVIAGILTVVWPGGTVLAIAVILGVYLVIEGPTQIAHGIALRGHTREWWLLLLRGVADLVLGVITLVWPGITVTVLALIFGIELLLVGGFEIGAAFHARASRGQRGWYLGQGVVAMLIGIVTLVWPHVTVLALALLFGFFLIYLGVILVGGAMRLRRAARA